MAKKIQSKLDDFGFDSSLDDFNFDFDFKPPKDDRKPSTKVLSGVRKGVVNTLKSESFIASTLKSLFPKGYGEGFDTLVDTKNQIKDLYNSVSDEFKETIDSTKRVVNKALPLGAQYLPGSLTKKLEKLTADYEKESNSYTYNDNNNNEINLALTEIFKLQSEAEDKKDHEKDIKNQLREGLALGRHKESISQLNAMRVSLSQLVTYQNKITSAYQKKSLEIQYRHFFIARDALIEQKRQGAETKAFLESINKNVALPDYVKLKSTERVGEALRNRFINSAMEGLLGSNSNAIKEVSARFAKNLKQNLGSALQGFRGSLASTESLIDTAKSASEMGFSGYELAGEFAGSALPYMALGSRYGKKAREALERRAPGLVKGGNDIRFHLGNAQGHINRFARSSFGSNSLLGFLIDPLKDALLQSGQSHSVDVDSTRNLREPGVFTRQTNKSINEVIPGLLSRIHQELSIIRTGNQNLEPIEYDYTRNRFDTQRNVGKNILSTVIRGSDKRYFQDSSNNLIDRIDPEKKLSKEARVALSQQFLEDNLHSRVISPERLTNAFTYQGGASRYAKQYSDLFKAYFADDQDHNKRADFSEGVRNLGRFIGVDKEHIQDLINMGQAGPLAQAGLLSFGGGNSSSPAGTINLEKYASFFSSLNQPSSSNRRRKNRNNASHPGGMGVGTSGLFSHPSEELGDYSATSIVDTIISQSPLEQLLTINNTLSAIERKLDSGVVTLSAGEMKGAQYERHVKEGTKERTNRYNRVTRAFMNTRLGKMTGGIKRFLGTNFSLLSSFGKTTDSIANTAYHELKRVLEGVSHATGVAFDHITARGQELTDIFVGSNSSPIIEGWKLKAGQYRDQLSGKVIKNFRDIKGAIVDDEGKVILSEEDLKNAYTRTKTGAIRRLSTLGARIGSNNFLKSTFNRLRSMDLHHTGIFARMKSVNLSKAKSVYDVYVKGEDEPVLKNWKLKAGDYIDSVTGKPITNFTNLLNDVYDKVSGKTIKLEDLKEAYTKTALGIKPFKILTKGGSFIGRVANGVLNSLGRSAARGTGLFNRIVGQGSKWFFHQPEAEGENTASDSSGTRKSPFEHTLSGIGALGSLAGRAGNAGVNFLTSIAGEGIGGFFKVFSSILEPVFRGKKIVDRLTEIRDMLDDRLPGKKIRKGSYEDQMNQKKEEEKENSAEALNEKLGSLSGNWKNSIYGMGAGALAKLFGRKKKKEGEEEDGDSDGFLSSILGTYLANKLGKVGSLAKRGVKFLGRHAGTLAGAGMFATGAYDMAAHHDFSMGNVAQTVGGALMTPMGRTAAMAAGGLALDAGGALLTGAGALIGTLGLPVVLGGALLAGGAYLGYKYFTRKKPDTLSTVRYIQYGFKIEEDSSRFRTLMEFDDKMSDYVVSSGENNYKLDREKIRKDILDIIKIFNINKEDNRSVQNFMQWAGDRYQPVFLKSYAALRKLNKEAKLIDIDDKLKNEEKLAFLKEIQNIDPGVYQLSVSPFREDRGLQTGPQDVSRAIDEAKAKIQKAIGPKSDSSVSGAVLAGTAASASASTPQGENQKTEKKEKGFFGKIGDFLTSTSIFNPFLPGVLVAKAGGSIVDWIKNLISGPTPNYLMEVRMLQYGYKKDTDIYAKILFLEGIAQRSVTNLDTSPNLIIASKSDIDQIFKRFGVDPANASDTSFFYAWLKGHFAPVLFKYLKALKELNKPLNVLTLDTSLNNKEKLYLLNSVNSDFSYVQVNVWGFSSPTYTPSVTIDEIKEKIKDTISLLSKGMSEDEKNQAMRFGVQNNDGSKKSDTQTPNTPTTKPSSKVDLYKNIKNPTTRRMLAGSAAGAASGALAGSAASNVANGTGVLNNVGAGPLTSSGQIAGGELPHLNLPPWDGSVRVLKGNGPENRKIVIAAAKAAGITDPKELAMFLAQLDHESGGFRVLSENLNYHAANLLKTFPKYVKSPEMAAKLVAGGPPMIASVVYGNRMGNNGVGEGWTYRGRGFIQLTGKNNYAQASRDLGIDLIGNPDLASDPQIAAKIAVWYWKKRNGLVQAGQRGDVNSATKLINGGLNGLQDRAKLYSSYLGMVQSGKLEGENSSPTSNTGDVATNASSNTAPSEPANKNDVSNSSVASSVNPALTQNSTVGGASTPQAQNQGVQHSGTTENQVNPTPTGSTSTTSVSTGVASAASGASALSSSYNPSMAMANGGSAQQASNSANLPSSSVDLSGPLTEGVNVSKQILDVNSKQLETLVEIVKTLKGLNVGSAPAAPTMTKSSDQPSNNSLDISNAPIQLLKRFVS